MCHWPRTSEHHKIGHRSGYAIKAYKTIDKSKRENRGYIEMITHG